MDYEKKYKDLVEAVKELQEANPSDEGIQKWVEDNIPELAESKDEKIRKLIIKHFKEIANSNGQSWISLDIPYILDWLEEQGEYANFRNKIQIGDKVTRNEDGVLVNLSQLKRVAKPADKVESKFKVGDWITNGDYTWKIVEVKPLDYILQSQDGNIVDDTISYVDKQFHFFTIEDAKPGDVLVSESNCGLGTWYCIFKSLDGDESMTVYCYLTRDGRFETKKELCFDKDPRSVKPATKEQRDTLEKAMADVGYRWNPDEKKLEKIEQKPWSEEDKKMLEYAINMIEWYSVVDKSKSKRVSDWLKFLKDRVQLQNLTVTDKELAQAKKEAYNDALNKIEYHSGEPTFDDGWSAAIWYFKKRNMQPQPKQEWSEEDNIMIHDIDYALRCQITYPISRLQSMSAWILNLKNRVQPQLQWKPSDEHMDALRYVTNFDYGGYKATLVSLYEQFKRLKEK